MNYRLQELQELITNKMYSYILVVGYKKFITLFNVLKNYIYILFAI